MGWRTGGVIALIFLGGLSVATQLFAFLAHYDVALGPVWARPRPSIAFYPPWAILQWGWAWGRLIPRAFVLPGALGGGTMLLGLLTLGKRDPQDAMPEAHWATWQDLRRAHCCGRTGVVLGRIGRRILRYEGDGHVLMAGVIGGGKTLTLYSTLLDTPSSLLLYDPKEALYATEWHGKRYGSVGYRRQLGPVLRLNPTRADTDGYNPFEVIDLNADDAVRQALLIADTFVNPEGTLLRYAPAEFYRGQGTPLLAGMLLFGLESELARHPSALREMVGHAAWKDLAKLMEASSLPFVQEQAQEILKLGRGSSGVRSTLVNALAVFGDPSVARMTERSTLPLSALREAADPCTIYMQIPFADHARLHHLSRLILRQFIEHATSRLHGWSHPLQVILEEFLTLDHFPFLLDSMGVAREYGVQFVLITPTFEEVAAIYGVHHALLEKTPVKLLFGVEDTAVAEQISQRIGTHTVPKPPHGRLGPQARAERLLSATGVHHVPRGTALLLTGNVARIVRQARFYERRVWRRRSRVTALGASL